MTIGIDISPLQGPHRMRGVGSVVMNLVNNIPEDQRREHKFVFYVEPDEETSKTALNLLRLNGVDYELRQKPPLQSPATFRLPSRLNLLAKLVNKFLALSRFRHGVPGYDSTSLNVFLLTDQMQSMPRMPGIKKIIIAYDLIPYILEWDYLWSYKTARHRGLRRKAALAAKLRRSTYISKVKINAKKSQKILAISEQTRKDFIKYAHAPKDKVDVVHLGVNPLESSTEKVPTNKYIATSWGYLPKPFKFDTETPFILFVGGTDARRKLDDLVTAFNHLRAQGYKIKLVLSGDILQGPKNLPVRESREALLNSSYAEDIIYLGFAEEEVKNWLYKHAMAFVYPSMYEGFGLPVLEAMSYGTPVITYKNSSIQEISGNATLFAHDYVDISRAIQGLLQTPSLRKKYSSLGKVQATKFSWGKTAADIMKVIS